MRGDAAERGASSDAASAAVVLIGDSIHAFPPDLGQVSESALRIAAHIGVFFLPNTRGIIGHQQRIRGRRGATGGATGEQQ